MIQFYFFYKNTFFWIYIKFIRSHPSDAAPTMFPTTRMSQKTTHLRMLLSIPSSRLLSWLPTRAACWLRLFPLPWRPRGSLQLEPFLVRRLGTFVRWSHSSFPEFAFPLEGTSFARAFDIVQRTSCSRSRLIKRLSVIDAKDSFPGWIAAEGLTASIPLCSCR